MEITDAMIDQGAKWLRETQQAGKQLNEWATLPNATKKKWRALSEGVLRAATQTQIA